MSDTKNDVADEFQLDQPWNPVSYFEEENEATGGLDTHGTAYSPSKLTSLFDTNVVLGDESILHNKQRVTNASPLFRRSDNENCLITEDLDDLNSYTIGSETNISALSNTYEFNRKLIFDDFDRLKNWQQSIEKQDKDTLMPDENAEENISYLISPSSEKDGKLLIDRNSENKDQSNSSSDMLNLNDDKKLEELEQRLSESDIVLPIDFGEMDEDSESLSGQLQDHNNTKVNLIASVENENSILPQNTVSIDNLLDVNNTLENNSLDHLDTFIDSMGHDQMQVMNNSNIDKDIARLLDLDTENAIHSSETVEIDDLVDIAENIVSKENSTSNKSIQTSNDITEIENDTSNLSENPDYSNFRENCSNTKDNNTEDENISKNDFRKDNENGEIESNKNISTQYNFKTESVGFSNAIEEISNEELDYLLDDLENELEEEINRDRSSKYNFDTYKDTVDGDPTQLYTKTESTSEITNLSNIENEYNECRISADDTETEKDSKDYEKNDKIPLELMPSDDKAINDNLELQGKSDIGIVINEGVTNLNDNVEQNCNNKLSEEHDQEDLTLLLCSTTSIENESNNSSIDEPSVCVSESNKEKIDASYNAIHDNSENSTQEVISNLTSSSLSDSSVGECTNIIPSETISEHESNIDDISTLNENTNTNSRPAESIIDNCASVLSLKPQQSETNDEVFSAREIESVDANVSEIIVENSNSVTVERNLNNDSIISEEERNQTEISNVITNQDSEALGPNSSSEEAQNGNNDNINQDTLSTNLENEVDFDDVTPPPLERSSSSSTRRVRFALNTNEGDDISVSSQDSHLSTTPLEQPQRTAESRNQVPITDEMRKLGWYAPKWVPDMDAKNCMTCDSKFTVVKRRHHCRACGKVLCSSCCNMRYSLPYLNYKQARVCQSCCDIMLTVLNQEPNNDFSQLSIAPPPLSSNSTTSSLPEAPPPYSEAIDGHNQRLSSVSSEAPPYSETSRFSEQPAPILTSPQTTDSASSSRAPSFDASSIGDLLNGSQLNVSLPSYSSSSLNTRQRANRSRTESEMSAVIMFNSTVTNLPPILRNENEETRIVNNPNLPSLFEQINDENADPISFIVNKNLVVRVKIVNMDCCVEKKCWCFVSDGMGASNQEEIVIIVKCDSHTLDDVTLTKKILTQMNFIFEKAKHGHPVSDLEHTEFESNMVCLEKNVGMLFFKLTLQCTKKLSLPTSPYLFGLYIEPNEVPWAKNFPLRLLLRIGAQFKYYPAPLFNVLDREPVYEGVGRTILDLLADFQNFQYTIPRVNGVTINLRGKDTVIKLPQHRYEEVIKIVNSCEDNVLSFAGNFSSSCDGHLVSVEKDGRYKTQTLSIVLKENRKVTCASFIVISAALKPSQEGIQAKASIVEDGVMVQVTASVMNDIKSAIKDMKSFSVIAGDSKSEEASKMSIEWNATEMSDRPRLESPIDGTSFDNLTNMKIRHSYDYTSNALTAKIHWVEVYFLPQDNDTVQRLSARELGQMTSSIAKACMSALSPHLMVLIGLGMMRIGLRVNLAADFVEYKIGSNLSTLPVELLPSLDDKLVPAIHSVMSNAQERVAVELIFQVVKIV